MTTGPQPVRIGIVGAGLMGRELAVAAGRWIALVDHPVRPVVTAVADPAPAARAWFDRVSTVRTSTDDWRRLADDPEIDLLYLAVPHDLHEQIYVGAADAGKDFLGEKPFGIDLPAAERIAQAVRRAGVFVRVSSELPFYPGALVAWELVRSGRLGEVLEVRSGLSHSSDIDRDRPINWKRRATTCGQLGVMGDLGMHVAHLPLRLGWRPASVYAMLDDVVRERPGPDGVSVPCDTWDNALLALRVAEPTRTDGRTFPMLWETKRIAPGQSNTWWFEAFGMDGGVRFNTRTPTIVERFRITDRQQVWETVQPGHSSVWPTSTGAIFEFGFLDAILQMWATFLAERAGVLGDRFATATVEEALSAHRIFDGALRSHETASAINLG
jgi:predicted dehydrogenase